MGRGTPKIIHDHFLISGEGKETRAAEALTPPQTPPLTTDYVALALASGRACSWPNCGYSWRVRNCYLPSLGINKFKLILFHSSLFYSCSNPVSMLILGVDIHDGQFQHHSLKVHYYWCKVNLEKAEKSSVLH